MAKQYRKGRKLENNPDYLRLQRYYEKEKRLKEQEKDAYKRMDTEALNIARGLLFNVRFQIREMEELLNRD